MGERGLALGCLGRGPQCSGEVHTRPRGPQPVDTPLSAQLAPLLCPGAQSTRAGCTSPRLSMQAGVRGRQLSPAPRWPTWDTTFPPTDPVVSPVPAPPSAHVLHVGFQDPTRLEETSSWKCGLGDASARSRYCLCPSSQCPPGGLHLVLNTPEARRPSRGPTTPCAPSQGVSAPGMWSRPSDSCTCDQPILRHPGCCSLLEGLEGHAPHRLPIAG